MEIRFDPDWKAVFERDFCEVCKNRNACPYNWQCHDMEEFIENNKEDKNVRNGNSSEKVRQ